MRDTVIVSACRTPIGAFGGSLRKVQAPILAAGVMKEAIKRAGMKELINEIQDIQFGSCLEPVDAMNVTRVAQLYAGLPDSIPAITVRAHV